MFSGNYTSFYTSFTLCRPWSGQQEFTEDALDSSKVKSDRPTRHIAIEDNDTLCLSYNSLFEDLKLLGGMKNTSPSNTNNLTLISYYKIKDAQEAIEFINKKYHNTFKANFAKPCVLKKPHNDRLLVILTTINDHKVNYMDRFLKYGSIYSFSKAVVSNDEKIINIEFDDERASEKIIQDLNNKVFDGIKYKIYKCDDDKISCTCHNNFKTPVNDDKIIRRPFPNLSQKVSSNQKLILNSKTPSGTNKSETFSYFSVCPFTSESDSSSITTKTISEGSISPVKEQNTGIFKKKENKPNEFDLNKIINGKDNRTTFMIRNIPNKYSQKMLIDCINKTHANTYDFLYLRMDFKNKCNVGYAFINFVNVQSAISFAKEKVGKKWEFFNSEKKCTLSYAEIQSRNALIRKFKTSPVMDEDEAFRPKIFYTTGPNKGQEQPFPKPKPKNQNQNSSSHRRSKNHNNKKNKKSRN